LQPQDLVLPQLGFGSFLFEQSLDITLLVLEVFDVLALSLDFALGLKTSLDSRLDLKAVFLEEAELLHEGVLFRDHLLVVL